MKRQITIGLLILMVCFTVIGGTGSSNAASIPNLQSLARGIEMGKVYYKNGYAVLYNAHGFIVRQGDTIYLYNSKGEIKRIVKSLNGMFGFVKTNKKGEAPALPQSASSHYFVSYGGAFYSFPHKMNSIAASSRSCAIPIFFMQSTSLIEQYAFVRLVVVRHNVIRGPTMAATALLSRSLPCLVSVPFMVGFLFYSRRYIWM